MPIGKWMAGTLVALAVLIGSSVATLASSGTTVSSVTVPSTAAIFLAGRTDVTIPAAGATLPPGYPLVRNSTPGPVTETFPIEKPAASGAQFQFSASGTFYPGGAAAFGPDGSNIAYRTLNPVGGISGYYGPLGPLLGVFLTNTDPENATEPATLNFAGVTSFTTLSPAIGQLYYICDGLTGTGSGTVQNFIAPPGATHLYLGMPDGINYMGTPGACLLKWRPKAGKSAYQA